MASSTAPDQARRILSAAAAALLFLACRGERAEVSSYHQAPVILISIDTLRADHLPLYGYGAVRTPNIDALAGDGVVFENAFSHVPLTLPSHLSILTGLLPQEHGVRDNIGYPFDAAKHPTVAALLKRDGYATGAAVSAYVLRGATGVSSGFDAFDDGIRVIPGVAVGNLQRPGEQTEAAAERWVGEHGGRPFFFFLHLFEPHSPYDPPEPYRSKYASAYDGEIAFSDQIVGRFLSFLKEKGIYDKAIIILLSDHGEGLMEHGEDEHGILLYREDIHVPLVLKLPEGNLKGRRIKAVAELTDILPTIAQLTGIPVPGGARGTSLALLAEAKAPPERRVYSETLYPRIHLGWSELRSLADARYHYIDAPRPELYDMKADPTEIRNVLAGQRRTYATMRKELDAYGRAMAVPENVDPEEAKKLAALGYISATRPTMEGNLPDPKDHIGDIVEAKAAFALAAQQKHQEAIRALEAILQKNPNWSDVWNRLAMTYEETGDFEKAVVTYKRAIAVAPTLAPEFALSLAAALENLGRFDEADANASLALKASPPGAHQLLGHIALTRGQLPRAEQEAEAARAYPSHRDSASMLLAQIYTARGELPRALTTLEGVEQELAAAHSAPMENLEFLRGDVLARMDRSGEAEAAFRKEIASFPHNRQAYANLALLQILQGRRAEADKTLEQMSAATPGRRTDLLAAKTLDALGDHAGAAAWRKRVELPAKLP